MTIKLYNRVVERSKDKRLDYQLKEIYDMTEMVEVRVFYDGTVEIKGTDSNHATQHLYITHGSKSGEMYICKKDEVDYYKKQLLKEIIKRQQENIDCIMDR